MRLLLCLVVAGWGARASGETPHVWRDSFPVEHPADQASAYEGFNQAPNKSLAALVDALGSTQAGERVAAEYALDGWTTHALRPGTDSGELAALESALVAAVRTATTGSSWNAAGAFLIGQLGKIGTYRSVEPLTLLFSEHAWSQDAALALQAFALPEDASRVREAAEAALVAASGRHHDILVHLMNLAQIPGPLPPEDSLEASREVIAARQTGDAGRQVCSALVFLADMLGDDAFPEVAAAMDHPDPSVRATARRLMEDCDSPRVSPWLLRRLEEQDPGRRAEALVLLTGRQYAETFERARVLTDDQSEAVRRAAFEACAALGGRAATDDLLEVYTGLNNGERSALLAVLIRYWGVSVADRAHELLAGSPGPQVEAAMLEVIGACMARAYVEDALFRVSSADAALAKQAVKTLKQLAGPGQVDTLLALLLDPDLAPPLRSSLAPVLVAALNEVPDEEGRIAPVRDLLPESTGDVRHDLHRILSGLQAAEAVGLLRADTSHSEATTRDSAVRALCTWNGFEAADPLLEIARATTNGTHNVLALRRLLQLVQEYRVTDDENPGHRAEARALYEAALPVARREEEKVLIRDALAGLAPELDAREDDAVRPTGNRGRKGT